MASTFENGQSLAVVRAILNGNADDITQLQLKIGGSNVLPIANGGTGTSVDAEYETRDEMVDNIASLLSIANGSVISAGSQLYQKVNSSTVISDLPNFIPFGQPTMAHWGVPIDGTTDATAKVREAVASGYPVILAQAGYYRLTNQVILQDCQIVGEGYDFLAMNVSTFNDLSGTVFLCNFGTGVAESLFYLKRSGQISQCMAYFIGQSATRPTNWVPVTTPWAVTTGSYTNTARTVRQERSGITDFCFLEFTHGIRGRTGGEQGYFARVRGNPFTVGIDFDANYDVTRFRDFHFWPFGGNANAWQLNERVWTLNNLSAYRFGRVDGLLMDGCFTIGAAIAIEFYPSTSGNSLNGTATTNFHVTDCYLDGANVSVQIAGTYAAGWYPSGQLVNCTMQHWDSVDNEIVTEYPNIVVSSQIKILQFVGCVLTAAGGNRNGSYVTFNAPNGVVNFSACSVSDWDLAATGAAAFVQTGASSQIVLNDMRYFAANNTIVYPSYGLVSGKAIASGNVLQGMQYASGTTYQLPSDGATTVEYIGAAAASNPAVRMRRSRGTLDAKTTTNTGDILGDIGIFGWRGDAYSQTSIIRSLAGSAGAGAPITGNVQFLLQNNSTSGGTDTYTQALTMTPTVISSPSAFLGLGTTAPARVLHVKNSTPIIRIEDTDTAVSTIYAEVQADTTGSLTLSADPGDAGAASSINFNVDNLEVADLSNSGYLRFNKAAFAAGGVCSQQSDNNLNLGGGQNPINDGVNFALSGSTNVSATAGFLFRDDTTQKHGWNRASDYFFWNTGGSERVRLTSTGALLIGATVATDRTLSVSKRITGATTAYGVTNNGEIQSDVTATAYMYRTTPGVAAAAFTLPNLFHYTAAQGAIGAGATVTNQVGYLVEASLIGAAANVGFQVNGVAAASVTTGKTVRAMQTGQATASGGGTAHNLYINGTAPSYFQGNVGLGTDAPARVLHVKNTNPSIRLEDADTGVSTIYAEIDATTAGSLLLKADPGNSAAGSNIQFEIDATELLRIGPSGQIGIAGANYGTAGQPLVSGGSGSVAWGPILTSGTYTPTLTITGALTANIQAATAFAQTQYSRNGDMVTVFGSVAIDPTTAATDTILLMSLPIASNLGSARQLAGTGAATTAGKYGECLGIEGEITTDQASISLRPSGTTNVPYTFSFTYQVI